MNPVIKGQKLKMINSLIVIILLTIALLKIVNGDVSFILLTMYGCTSTPVIMLKAAFFLFIILLQYFCADLILYYIENADYLCIRYGDRKRVFGVLLKKIIFLDIVFVGLSLAGTGVSLNVAHSNTDWCNIAGKASDMHVEVSLELTFQILIGAISQVKPVICM
ncbi:MAG: hypothetical protein K2O34_00410 [Acetatifactor sp.]|nr:hypothetical protein [Acetatifactor sp.]